MTQQCTLASALRIKMQKPLLPSPSPGVGHGPKPQSCSRLETCVLIQLDSNSRRSFRDQLQILPSCSWIVSWPACLQVFLFG